MGEVISQNCPTSPFFKLKPQGQVVLHRIYRKNIPKDYHFSSKLEKIVKTSPCFNCVGLPLSRFGLSHHWGVNVSGSWIAQSVKQLPCNQCVLGSSPSLTAHFSQTVTPLLINVP